MRAFLKPDEVLSNLVEGTKEALNSVSDKTVERMGEKPDNAAPWSSGQDIALSRR